MAMTFRQFEMQMLAQGFDEVLQRDWAPLTVVATHTHPFAAKALLVRGEMWLLHGEATQHIVAGGTFEIAPDEAHAERYGTDGATYWVARRAKLAA